MKRACELLLVFCVTGALTCQSLAVNTSAVSSILVEKDSGRVLFEENPDEQRLIASITKIMTAVVALERGDINAPYTVTPQDMAEGSSMYLKVGEVLTLEELLYGLLLASGNDAALAVAHCVSGELSAFVDAMNETARALGMRNSSFKNPNGLDAEGHYSSARDMAVLTAYALNNDTFSRIVSSSSAEIGKRQLANHNKLLTRYDGCIGVKTGFTKAAGRTLVSAAERNGMTLICVTLKDGNDWEDHTRLLDHGFENYAVERYAAAGDALCSVPVRFGTKNTVALAAASDLGYPVANGETLAMELKIPCSMSAPVELGRKVGEARLLLNGTMVAEADLVAVEMVETQAENQRSDFFSRLFN